MRKIGVKLPTSLKKVRVPKVKKPKKISVGRGLSSR